MRSLSDPLKTMKEKGKKRENEDIRGNFLTAQPGVLVRISKTADERNGKEIYIRRVCQESGEGGGRRGPIYPQSRRCFSRDIRDTIRIVGRGWSGGWVLMRLRSLSDVVDVSCAMTSTWLVCHRATSSRGLHDLLPHTPFSPVPHPPFPGSDDFLDSSFNFNSHGFSRVTPLPRREIEKRKKRARKKRNYGKKKRGRKRGKKIDFK